MSSVLRPVTLSDQAYKAIRGQIIAGELTQGVIYPISQFANAMEISATPIRDALQLLSNQGLIEIIRNRGFRVRALDEHDLDEIAQLRRLLEVPAASQVALLGHIPFMGELRSLAAAVETSAEKGDLIAWLDSDREFHLRLLSALGNSRLVDLVGLLRDQVRLYGLHRLAASGQLLASTREHSKILDAIERGDQAETERWMEHHLSHVRGIWAGHEEADK